MTECMMCGKKKSALKTLSGRSDDVCLCEGCCEDVTKEILTRAGWPTEVDEVNPALVNQMLGAMLMSSIVLPEVKNQVIDEILQGKFGKSGAVE